MRRLALVLPLFFSSFLLAQSCPANQWCQIYSKPLLRNSGYNNIFFSHDTGKFYLFAGNTLSPSTAANGPEANAFWSYQVRTEAADKNPWVEVSDCGSTARSEGRSQLLSLSDPIDANAKSLTVKVHSGGEGLINLPFPQSGTFWIEDEAMDYSGCTSAGESKDCGRGASALTLDNLKRGVRRQAGWLSPSAHPAGALANLACAAPTLAGAPAADHPPDRHSAANPAYDSKRGRLWVAWGWQERYSLQDTWFLCAFQTAACTSEQISAGWQRLPLFSAGGEEPGGYTENATVYDPDNDVLVSFGGLRGGNSSADTFVFCLSDKAYGCSSRTLNHWVKVSTHGTPGPRDAARLVWDSAHHRILAFGGVGNSSAGFYNTVAIYNAAAGDWCVSDPHVGAASNASSCKLPGLTGNPPPREKSTKFPAWTFDSKRGKGAFFNGKSVYEYDAGKNHWDVFDIGAGPSAAAIPQQSHQSWAYDDLHDVFVWVSTRELWQLPGAALDKAVPAGQENSPTSPKSADQH